MKKFLKLKKSIIQSKDEPMLTQIYIDSIRSSCYKIAQPDLLQPHHFKSDFSSIPSEHSFNQFKSIQSRSFTPTQKLSAKLPNNPYISKIEDIIQTIQSACKSEQNRYNNAQQIIQKIMGQLDLLQKNSMYRQPIQLIRKIIESMPKIGESGKLIETQTPMKNYLKKFQSQRLPQLEQSSQYEVSNDKQNHNVANISMQEPTSGNKQSEDEIRGKIQYKAYFPGENIQGESIYIDDQSVNGQQSYNSGLSETQRTFSEGDQSEIFQGLQKITEKDEEQSSISSNTSKQKTSIQMRKIMYMLENSTNKKKNRANIPKYMPKSIDERESYPSNERTVSKQGVIISSRVSVGSNQSSNKSDKTKTIKDIVKLLDIKYNRTVKFEK